ncbi:hypothetical protein AAY473_007277 [Plecturocebus cupreus]
MALRRAFLCAQLGLQDQVLGFPCSKNQAESLNPTILGLYLFCHRLECSGVILVHGNLRLLGSNQEIPRRSSPTVARAAVGRPRLLACAPVGGSPQNPLVCVPLNWRVELREAD